MIYLKIQREGTATLKFSYKMNIKDYSKENKKRYQEETVRLGELGECLSEH